EFGLLLLPHRGGERPLLIVAQLLHLVTVLGEHRLPLVRGEVLRVRTEQLLLELLRPGQVRVRADGPDHPGDPEEEQQGQQPPPPPPGLLLPLLPRPPPPPPPHRL